MAAECHSALITRRHLNSSPADALRLRYLWHLVPTQEGGLTPVSKINQNELAKNCNKYPISSYINV
jgi:hypothetical protein